MNKNKQRASLTWNDSEGVGYLTLPDHPRKGTAACVERTIDLRSLDPSIKGIQVLIDLDEENRVIGIELLE